MDSQEKAAADAAPAEKPLPEAPEVVPAAAPQSAKAVAKLSRRRLWLFRLLSLTVVPALTLTLLELGLRLCGYGFPTSFFVDNPGQPGTSIANVDYGRR